MTTPSRGPRAIPFGKFLLLERLSRSSGTEVFLAKTFGVEGFEKFVAIKRMRAGIAKDKAATERFIEGAKRLGAVSHAHVTPIYELGKVGDTHYMGLEHVWGKSLGAVIERAKGKMPPAMAAFIGAKMCDGAHFAHSRRVHGRPDPVLHGDMAPDNVLVSYEGAVKLIDFAAPDDDDGDALLDGRFAYRSPEQVAGGAGARLDARSDVYAIAACVYHMATGQAPDADRIEKPTALRGDLPAAFNDVLMKALSRDRQERTKSASELQSALLKIITGGGRPFTTARLADWMRKHFAEEMTGEKARLNLYAQIESPEDAARFTPPPDVLDDDPFAAEPTVVTEPLFPEWDDAEEDWEDAPTQVYFSSGTLSQEGEALDPKGFLSQPPPAAPTIQVAPEALEPQPEKRPRSHEVTAVTPRPGQKKKKKRSRKDTPHLSRGDRTGSHPAQPRTGSHAAFKGRRSNAVHQTWYLAGALAIILIGLVVYIALSRTEGQVEVHEVAGVTATVSIDGHRYGTTPLRIEHVATGSRRLVVSAEGYETYEGDVTVTEDSTRLVEVRLQVEGMAPGGSPGTLVITTDPLGAHVALDGNATGRQTPVPQMRVSAGSHRLRLTTEDGRVIEEEIFVDPGETLRIVRRFP